GQAADDAVFFGAVIEAEPERVERARDGELRQLTGQARARAAVDERAEIEAVARVTGEEPGVDRALAFANDAAVDGAGVVRPAFAFAFDAGVAGVAADQRVRARARGPR